jgi:tripartite ATP-independent transporter DctP family solute receptor
MKSKRFVLFALVWGLVSLSSGANAKDPEIVLRFAGNLPVGHHITRGQEYFAKLIEEKTGGRVKVEVYPGGQLFQDKDMVKAVPSGVVDMAEVTLSQWTGVAPSLLLLDLPLYFEDRAHIWRTVDGEAGELMAKQMEGVGVKLLYYMDYGMIQLASRSPLKTLDDFKGKKIRAFGELPSEALKLLGASPVFLGGGEVYMGLQRGTIDGAISGVSSFWERNYFEVTQHLTMCDFSFAMFAVLMNLNKWESLAPDIQNSIAECAIEAKEWSRKECELWDTTCESKLKDKMTVYYTPGEERQKWREKLSPIIGMFKSRAGKDLAEKLLEYTERVRDMQ